MKSNKETEVWFEKFYPEVKYVNRLLRALRPGIPLHGTGQWRTGDDKYVYSSVNQA